MPQGDKIELYGQAKNARPNILKRVTESRGLSAGESKKRAWATVNKMTHGGKKSGSGRGKSGRPFACPQGWSIGRAGAKRTPESPESRF